jgi:hypothetical protein
VLLALAVWGALQALLRRRFLFLATVPYVAAAIVFFSFWSKPDPRYLSGVYVLLPMLIVEGVFSTLDRVRELWRGKSLTVARYLAFGFGVVLLAGAALNENPPGRSALPTLTLLLPIGAAAAAFAAGLWPHRRVALLAAPALAVTLVVITGVRAATAHGERATFQRPQMERARATFEKAIGPQAVVITMEDVGRPAENIDYYTTAEALYLTDIMRWHMSMQRVVGLLLYGGFTPYLLLPHDLPERDQIVGELEEHYSVEVAADIPPPQAIDYFVAASFHRGLHMELLRIGRRRAEPASP